MTEADCACGWGPARVADRTQHVERCDCSSLAVQDDYLTTEALPLRMSDSCSISPGPEPATGCSPRSACGDAGSHPRGMALSSCSCSWMVWWGTCTQTGSFLKMRSASGIAAGLDGGARQMHPWRLELGAWPQQLVSIILLGQGRSHMHAHTVRLKGSAHTQWCTVRHWAGALYTVPTISCGAPRGTQSLCATS